MAPGTGRETGDRTFPSPRCLPVCCTATAAPRHVEPLTRLRDLLGDEAADRGLLVCGVERERPMPGGHLALPWQAFPAWLGQLLDGTR